jgi:hypothetical protein
MTPSSAWESVQLRGETHLEPRLRGPQELLVAPERLFGDVDQSRLAHDVVVVRDHVDREPLPRKLQVPLRALKVAP